MKVYSVFILSGSIGITALPPDELLNCSDESFGGIWTCTVLKYTYLSACSFLRIPHTYRLICIGRTTKLEVMPRRRRAAKN